MSVVRVKFVELYEPWEFGGDEAGPFPTEADIPDELIQRFSAAKAEMEAVWEALRPFVEKRWAV